MAKYSVVVEVVYHVNAKNQLEAIKIISEGAEYPVVPYNDGTYTHSVNIESVKVS